MHNHFSPFIQHILTKNKNKNNSKTRYFTIFTHSRMRYFAIFQSSACALRRW